MKTRKLPVQRILEASQGAEIVGDNEALDGTVGYRLGRLKKWCESVAKMVQKLKEKEHNKFTSELNSKDTTMERKKEIVKIINDKIQAILDIEEEIRIPDLKLSDFTAKADKTIKYLNSEGKPETREVKEGQMLVPQAFFNLMGDIIEDDKTGDKYVAEKKKSALELYLENEEKEEKIQEEKIQSESAAVLAETTETAK